MPISQILRFVQCAVALIAVSACAISGPSDVQIRIQNVSTVDYDSVTLMGHELGSVPAGQLSEYSTFDVAYRYGYVRILVAGKNHELTPIDFVGEKPLADGLYTYRILFVPETGALSLEFVVDSR